MVPVLYLKNGSYTRSLAEIDLVRSKGYITHFGTPTTVSWMVDGDGRALARAEYANASGDWKLLLRQGNDFRPVYTETAPLNPPGLVSFGRDTSSFILTSHKSGEWRDYEISRADGSVTGPTDAYKGDSVLLNRRQRTVIGMVETKLDQVEYQFFNPADQTLLRGLARTFGNQQVRLESWSDGRQTIIVAAMGPKNGFALFLIDRRGRTASPLVLRYQGLEPELLSPVTTLCYEAADGLEIPAYLTMPRGRDSKNLPLVLLAHGGPAARDEPGFDWWAQALASRGYAVQ